MNTLKTITAIIFLLMAVSCHSDQKSTGSPSPDSSISVPDDDALAREITDTATIFDRPYIARPDTGFLPVYELSPKTMGITMSVDELAADGQENAFDSLLHAVFAQDSMGYLPEWYSPSDTNEPLHYPLHTTVLDSFGLYPLYHNSTLEAEMKQRINSSYYVYGTRGVMECRVKNILFFLGPCYSVYYTLTLTDYDQQKCGHPLWSYSKLLPISYDGDYAALQKVLNADKRRILTDSTNSYKDSIYPIVYAHMDSFYFSYQDDFLWTARNQSSTSCAFPTRQMIRKDAPHQYRTIWRSEFDGFGTACD